MPKQFEQTHSVPGSSSSDRRVDPMYKVAKNQFGTQLLEAVRNL